MQARVLFEVHQFFIFMCSPDFFHFFCSRLYSFIENRGFVQMAAFSFCGILLMHDFCCYSVILSRLIFSLPRLELYSKWFLEACRDKKGSFWSFSVHILRYSYTHIWRLVNWKTFWEYEKEEEKARFTYSLLKRWWWCGWWWCGWWKFANWKSVNC